MATLTVSPTDEKRVKALGFLSNKGTDNFSGRIITVNGKITAAQQQCIAEAAEKFGNGNITFTTRLTIEVQGTTCQYGLLDSFALSEEIHHRFYEGYHTVRLPHKFKIAVGGCPNNCVKPDLNDLGIIGQRIPNLDPDECNGCKKCGVVQACPMGAATLSDGVAEIDKSICNNCGRCVDKCHFDAMDGGTYGYKIYIGGRWGKKVAQGRALSKVFTDKEEALNVIEKAILLFREQGKTGERFAKTIERLGFENVEAQLLSDDLLQRKQQILDAELHLVGGATC